MRSIENATARGINSASEVVTDRKIHPPQQDCVRGIVVAGVHAWGDCVLESIVCRPLLPVASRPLIWHSLRWMGQGGIREATICGNSDTRHIREKLAQGDDLGLSISYCEDVMPRGPAGCVRDAAARPGAETFVVVEGTVLPQIDLGNLLETHRKSRASLTVVAFGDESTNGHRDPLRESAGIYVFSRSAVEKVPEHGYQDIKEGLIPNLYRTGHRMAIHYVPHTRIPRVTNAASYLSMNLAEAQRLVCEMEAPQGYRRVDEGLIHSSAQVHPTARLVGPHLIGPRSMIEAGAILVGPTTIGAECRIDGKAVVGRSAVWDRCHVGPSARVDQCILTDDCEVDGGLAVWQTVQIPPRRSKRRLWNRWMAAWRRGKFGGV